MSNSTVFFILVSISFVLIGSSIRYYYYGYFYKNWETHNGKITKSSINKGIDAELNDVYFSTIGKHPSVRRLNGGAFPTEVE
jgi:hypothetical protein